MINNFMPTKDNLEFSILLFKGGCFNDARIKFSSDEVFYKDKDENDWTAIKYDEIDGFYWFSRSRGHCLRIRMLDERTILFDGWKSSDQEKLSNFLDKHLSAELQKQFRSLKGWNWGNTEFKGNCMSFNVDSKLAFEIPLNEVSRCTTSKNEVTLSFHLHDSAPISLTEMRFHIPTEQKVEDGDPVENFYEKVMNKADTIQPIGDAIAHIDQVSCLTPRGRYDLIMFATFLQLHGKTFDYKISYNDILRLFSLPHKDRKSEYFVLHVDPPIKQGQTRYHFLICTFDRYEEDSEIDIELSEKDLKKYGGTLKKKMSGQWIDLISTLMTALTKKKISVPGSFSGMNKSKCLSCSHKASTGFLYPLEKGFIFVHKPPIYVRYDEVATINFSRSGTSTRSFDLDVETKTGIIYTFSNVEKDEYGKLQDFLKKKTLHLTNIGKIDVKDSEKRHDAYLEMMKAEGMEKDEESEEESDDEDFVAEESGSDVAEEFDSEHSSNSDENNNSDSENKKDSDKKKVATKEKSKINAKENKKEKKPKRENTKKSKKDKNAPKRPLSAYFIWLNKNREKIKSENPGITFLDITKKGAEMWNKLTDKSEWQAEAEKAKKKYEIDMIEYRKKLQSENLSTSNAKSKSPKKRSAASSNLNQSSVKSGSGSGYKSKEFIEVSESSDSDSEDKKTPKKKLKSTEKENKKSVSKKSESESEESESGGESESEEPSMSDDESD